MAIYYALGEALVTNRDLQEKQRSGELDRLEEATSIDDIPEISFPTGQMNLDNVITDYTAADGDRVSFEPIGIGKPLTIEFRHVYTGKYPVANFFDPDQDMMITSAMKSIATFNAAPRALNFVQRDVTAKTNTANFPATQDGTPLIHYTPALLEGASVLTLELDFDEFPDQFFNMVSSAFTQAAGVPVFLSYSAYLLAAGTITRILSDVGNRLLDREPAFKATVPLDFGRPGRIEPIADFRLVVEDDVDPNFLREYGVGPEGVLQDKDGNRYDGDIPYVVISLDGRKVKAYEEFTPTAASSVLLQRFYGLRENQEKPLGELMEALKLYNDWKFRQRADTAADELKEIEERGEINSVEYKQKQKEYDAAVANILNKALKPK
jgi:hypothetical protein